VNSGGSTTLRGYTKGVYLMIICPSGRATVNSCVFWFIGCGTGNTSYITMISNPGTLWTITPLTGNQLSFSVVGDSVTTEFSIFYNQFY
jgi:hypothetical protein